MEPYLESLDVAQRDFTEYVKALDPQAITITDISPGDLLVSLEYVANYPIPREIKLTQTQRLSSHERYLRLQATFDQSTKLLNDKAIELGASDEGAPGERLPIFYGAYIRDPDGNKICFYEMTL